MLAHGPKHRNNHFFEARPPKNKATSVPKASSKAPKSLPKAILNSMWLPTPILVGFKDPSSSSRNSNQHPFQTTLTYFWWCEFFFNFQRIYGAFCMFLTIANSVCCIKRTSFGNLFLLLPKLCSGGHTRPPKMSLKSPKPSLWGLPKPLEQVRKSSTPKN